MPSRTLASVQTVVAALVFLAFGPACIQVTVLPSSGCSPGCAPVIETQDDIQCCIDAAKAEGATIEIPPGTYHLERRGDLGGHSFALLIDGHGQLDQQLHLVGNSVNFVFRSSTEPCDPNNPPDPNGTAVANRRSAM